jgi:hypothetical protein|tara:strand:- start:4548 stop:5210 length:663 start_codon:yes stop_codon:yes gene_type:complete
MAERLKLLGLVVLTSVFSTLATMYLMPRVNDRWEAWTYDDIWERQERHELDQCPIAKTYLLAGRGDTIQVEPQGAYSLKQNYTAVPDMGVLLEVREPGVLDIDMKLEATHQGDGYGKVIGFGAHVTYQYAATREGLQSGKAETARGWIGGTNIRDLRDHYGQVNLTGAVPVERGFYWFCVRASAHSGLTPNSDLAHLNLDADDSMNVLRLSFKPGGRLLK